MVQQRSGGTKQSASDQFFVPKLTAPGFVIRISISLFLIEDLGIAIIEALKAVPRRGLEIGGILLGRLDAARSTILIEDYEPVDSEHLHGPSWLLSPRDRSALRRALDRLRDRGPEQARPVGFYRSQTRDGLSFDAQDNALIRETFTSEPALCLLVKPSIAEPSVAQMGMMTGTAPEDLLQPVAVFPFHAGVLRDGDFQIVEGSLPIVEHSSPAIGHSSSAIEDSLPATENLLPVTEDSPPLIEDSSAVIEESLPATEDSQPIIEDSHPVIEDSSPVIIPAEPPPPALPVSAPARQRERRRPLTAMLLAIAAAILVCAFLVARLRTPHATPLPPATTAGAPPAAQPAVTQAPIPNQAVLLNVERQNGTATLTWNRDAPTVKNAAYALLLISDGRTQKQLRLSKTDLETGRVVYIPRSRNVSFRLQLFAQSHSTTESARSVADLPATPPPASDSHPRPRRLSAAVKRPGGEQPETAAAPPVYHAPETTPAAPSAVSQPSVQPGTPPAVAQPAPAPQAAAANTGAPKPTPFPEPDQTPPRPRDPQVETTVSLEFVGHSGIRDVLGNLSPRHIFGSGSDKTTPPRVIRQVLPAIYPTMASRIHGTRQVEVKITVGVGGQVVKAEFPDGHAADPVDSAVYYAARQWTFQAARNGDNKPVESKVLMHFVLKRSN